MFGKADGLRSEEDENEVVIDINEAGCRCHAMWCCELTACAREDRSNKDRSSDIRE